jgi:hypothetical protein
MTTIREAAQEFDVTDETITVMRDQIADDSDLWNEDTREITDAGMEVMRTALATNTDPIGQDLLDEVAQAAITYQDAAIAASEALERRDDAIRAAVAYGHKRTQVADLAEISRERLYQIL